jgi:hypothetical protein
MLQHPWSANLAVEQGHNTFGQFLQAERLGAHFLGKTAQSAFIGDHVHAAALGPPENHLAVIGTFTAHGKQFLLEDVRGGGFHTIHANDARRRFAMHVSSPRAIGTGGFEQ